MKAVIAGVAVLLVLVVVIYFAMSVSYSNGEIRLRKQVVAQQKSNEAVFDNTWKIIQQQAGIATEYKDAFRQIYPELMQGRYGNARGGALMSWIQEHNPQFDPRLYEKVANSVEVQRTIFTNEQRKLIDLQREHATMLETFPGSWFLAGRQSVEIKIVTSAKTETAFATGKDDDVDLFKHPTTTATTAVQPAK